MFYFFCLFILSCLCVFLRQSLEATERIMYALTFLFLTSVILALVLTPLVRNLAWHFGLVDQPDQKRKIHITPTPRVGGVAVFASVLCAYGLLLAVGLSSGHIVREDSNSPSGVRLKVTPMRSKRSIIAGAASHISLTGVWLARKSPP